MENEQSELKEVMKTAKENMKDFNTIIDLFDLTFAYINDESALLTGYTSKELIRKPISLFYGSSNHSKDFQSKLVNTMSDGIMDLQVFTKKGEKKVIKIAHKLVKVKDHPYLIIRATD